MNSGQVNFAERKAMELFDQWNDATGKFEPGTSYYAEIEACIVDAVHVGIQMALYGHVKTEDGNVIRGDSEILEEVKVKYLEPPAPPPIRYINEDIGFKNLICYIFGHNWKIRMIGNDNTYWYCKRCGKEIEDERSKLLQAGGIYAYPNKRCGKYQKPIEWLKPGTI